MPSLALYTPERSLDPIIWPAELVVKGQSDQLVLRVGYFLGHGVVQCHLNKPPRSLSIPATRSSSARFFFSSSCISSCSNLKSWALVCASSEAAGTVIVLPSMTLSRSSLSSPIDVLFFILANCPVCLDTRASNRLMEEVSRPWRVLKAAIFSGAPGIGLCGFSS